MLSLPGVVIMHYRYSEIFLFFASSSFLGWILESGYRTIKEQHWVNSGFLFGPFVPIYGLGAMTVFVLSLAFKDCPWFVYWPVLMISPTVIEFSVSFMLEKIFGMRLWDYSKERFNLYGRVCLLSSSIWALLVVASVYALNPILVKKISAISIENRFFLFGALLMYFSLDLSSSIMSLVGFKNFISDMKKLISSGGTFIPSFNQEINRLPRELHHLLKPLKSHPNLVSHLKPVLHAIPAPLAARLVDSIGTHHFHG
jgi:uncharacterized membrane protein